MLDKDLADLYGVPVKRLNEQVKRNLKRFPLDFMFQLTQDEFDSLRSQTATLKNLAGDENMVSRRGRHRKYLPYVFTEQGVAMLSTVLKSEKAIQVNIVIMRAFVKLREILSTHKELAHRLREIERKVGEHDQEIRLIFKTIHKLMALPTKPKSKIGFHP